MIAYLISGEFLGVFQSLLTMSVLFCAGIDRYAVEPVMLALRCALLSDWRISAIDRTGSGHANRLALIAA